MMKAHVDTDVTVSPPLTETADSTSEKNRQLLILDANFVRDTVTRCLNSFLSKLVPQNEDVNKNRNYFQSMAVRFRPSPPVVQMRFYDVFTLRKKYTNLFKSFHFIKDACENDVHIIWVRLKGMLPRATFKRYMRQLVWAICGTEEVLVRKWEMKGRQSCTSGTSVMRQVAGYKKENILMVMVDEGEPPVIQKAYMNKVDLAKLVEVLTQEFLQQVTTVCLAPHGYDTILAKVQTMNPSELKTFLRERDIESLFHEIQSQMFDVAVSNVAKRGEIRQILSDECVKLQVCTTVHDKIYPPFIRCVLGRDGFTLDHPPFYYSVRKNLSQLYSYGVTDLSIYNTDFIVPVLLIARYIARVCAQDADTVSSNGSALLLQGAAGAGKSLIVSTIQRYTHGYKMNCDTIYQGPAILSSSTIVLEEVRLEQLNTPLYKQLLDFTSAAKIEIKNSHPVDGSKHCSIIMNTNENIHAFLQPGRHQNKYQRFSEEQLEAVRRRLTIVPFPEKFTVLHQLDSTAKMQMYAKQFKKFNDMEIASPSLFNFFMAFQLYQHEYNSHETSHQLKSYMYKMTQHFDKTVFGRMYIQNKETLDALLRNLEDMIKRHTDERVIEKAFMRTSNELDILIDRTFLDIINTCPDSKYLQNIWQHPQWTDASKFMKKIVVSENESFQRFTWNQHSLSFVVPRWLFILTDDEFRFNTDSEDNDLLSKDEESEVEGRDIVDQVLLRPAVPFSPCC